MPREWGATGRFRRGMTEVVCRMDSSLGLVENRDPRRLDIK
jgi:hypothetical protein